MPVSFAASGSSFLSSHSSRIIPVEIRSFESVGRGSSFYPEKLFAGVLSACARASVLSTARTWNCTFKVSLFPFLSFSRKFKRNDIDGITLRSRVHICYPFSHAILFFKERRCFSARGAPHPPICILKQQILEYVLITRRDGSTYSEVKVAAQYGRGEPFCKFRYFIVPSGAFNSPLLLSLSGRVYGASRTFDKL